MVCDLCVTFELNDFNLFIYFPCFWVLWILLTCRMPVHCLVRTPYLPTILCGRIHQSKDNQLQYHLAMNHYCSFPTTPWQCMLTPVRRICHFQPQSLKTTLASRHWWRLLHTHNQPRPLGQPCRKSQSCMFSFDLVSRPDHVLLYQRGQSCVLAWWGQWPHWPSMNLVQCRHPVLIFQISRLKWTNIIL